jgi:hypothetical protein
LDLLLALEELVGLLLLSLVVAFYLIHSAGVVRDQPAVVSIAHY